MSRTTINKLLMAIAVLIVGYGLLLFSQNRQAAPGVTVPVNMTSLRIAADRFELSANGDKVILEKRGNKWFAGTKRVATQKITAFLESLEEAAFIRVVATEPKDPAIYGLDQGQVKSLKVFQSKKLLKTLFFGAMATSNSYYIRIGAEVDVYEAEGDLLHEVSQPIGDWSKQKQPVESEQLKTSTTSTPVTTH